MEGLAVMYFSVTAIWVLPAYPHPRFGSIRQSSGLDLCGTAGMSSLAKLPQCPSSGGSRNEAPSHRTRRCFATGSGSN